MPLRTKEVLAGKFFCTSFTGHAWNYGPAHSAGRVGEEVFTNISASKEDWGNVHHHLQAEERRDLFNKKTKHWTLETAEKSSLWL